MGIQAVPNAKYAIIREATLRDRNLLKISTLCRIAGVSRSGYYNWCASSDARQTREDANRRDFDPILEAFAFAVMTRASGVSTCSCCISRSIIMNAKAFQLAVEGRDHPRHGVHIKTCHVAEGVKYGLRTAVYLKKTAFGRARRVRTWGNSPHKQMVHIWTTTSNYKI